MKKILVFLAASVLMIGNASAEIAWDGQTATAWTQGDGSASSPYIIATPSNLAYLAQQVRTGNSYTGKFFEQTEDFDLNYVWRSIGGVDADYPTAAAFEGTYNGGGHYIKNVDNNHLFGLINNATIQNLTMVADQAVMSTMVNETNGACVITNCTNTAPRESEDFYYGAIVNEAKGQSLTLTWCNNYGAITVYGSADYSLPYIAVGGIVGISYAQELNMTRCSNNANIIGSAQATPAVGGLVGGVIEGVLAMNQCSSTGNIMGDAVEMGSEYGIGHLVGLVEELGSATILRSYAKGLAYNYLVGNCRDNNVFAKGCYVIDDANNWESAYFKPKANTYNCYYVNTLNMDYSDMGYNFAWSTYSSYCFHSCSVNISRGTYVSAGEIKSPEFLSRINGDEEEFFVMDLDNINSGYPIMKWLEGIRYTITTTCDATRGTVKGGGKYGEGNSVTLIATPKDGCTFVGWSDGNTDNPRTIKVTGDATYIAQFTKSQYTIYINQDCSSYIE